MKGMSRKSIIITVSVVILAVIAGMTLYMTQAGEGEIEKKLALANQYITEEKYEEAILAFQEIINIDENSVEARVGLASAYTGLGEYDKAEEVLRRGLALDGTQTAYWDALLELYKKAGKSDLEIQELMREAFDATGDEKYKPVEPTTEATTTIENQDLSDTLIPLDDSEKVITFQDADFEQFIRNLYGLGDGEIRWKDVGYQTQMSNNGSVESSFTLNADDLKWFVNLKQIDLHDIPVQGELSGLSVLKNLESIKVGDTSFSVNQNGRRIDEPTTNIVGNINDLKSLTKLEFIHICGNNEIVGDVSILNTLPLEYVDLTGTSVSGDISILSGLSNLKWLDLSSTSVSGNISTLSSLSKLESIYLSSTSVSGDIKSLRGFSNLRAIRLSSTSVSGNMSSLRGLINLREICLSSTSVSGDISALSDLSNLKRLDLSFTSVSGNISALSGLSNLMWIVLSETSVSGDISALSGLSNLERIYFDMTEVSGDISALSELSNLEYIDLYSTNVVGDTSALSALSNLKYIYLFEISISGDIRAFSNLSNLECIWLDKTGVSGDLSSLSGLGKLKQLSVDNTNVTGTLTLPDGRVITANN